MKRPWAPAGTLVNWMTNWFTLSGVDAFEQAEAEGLKTTDVQAPVAGVLIQRASQLQPEFCSAICILAPAKEASM